MAQSIWNLDFSRTVRDYDFTRKAMQGISRVVTSDDFEDMDAEEAAKAMGKTKKQVYNLTERGKKALRAELERMGFEYAQRG